ncbi:MAG: hypothetical protein COA49_05665 [Bacteroidetes bacterium]|nr:MAG: hypothetical protein COA49_05665 [Bacteroidota bacterium]
MTIIVRYKWLLLSVLVIINTPWVVDVLGLKEPHPLHGESTRIEAPEFLFETVWSGEFQDGIDEYFRTNFLLRGVAIRTRNQIDYSLFKLRHARSIVAGLDGYLFEENYILAALGLDSLPVDSIVSRTDRICELSKNTGVPVLVVFAPGKGSYFREFLPTEYTDREGQKKDRLYNAWSDEIETRKQLITLLDLHKYFEKKIEVFPKNGIHWSQWAQVEAVNLMIEKLNELLPDSLFAAHLVIDDSYRSSEMQGTDEDIEQGLNLWQNLEDLEATYYRTHWDLLPTSSRPKVLVMGDSYAWGPVNLGLLKHGFRDSEFWFYNSGVHGPLIEDKGASPMTVHGYTNRQEFEQIISEFDALILLSTDANLPRFPFKFAH